MLGSFCWLFVVGRASCLLCDGRDAGYSSFVTWWGGFVVVMNERRDSKSSPSSPSYNILFDGKIQCYITATLFPWEYRFDSLAVSCFLETIDSERQQATTKNETTIIRSGVFLLEHTRYSSTCGTICAMCSRQYTRTWSLAPPRILEYLYRTVQSSGLKQ